MSLKIWQTVRDRDRRGCELFGPASFPAKIPGPARPGPFRWLYTSWNSIPKSAFPDLTISLRIFIELMLSETGQTAVDQFKLKCPFRAK